MDMVPVRLLIELVRLLDGVSPDEARAQLWVPLQAAGYPPDATDVVLIDAVALVVEITGAAVPPVVPRPRSESSSRASSPGTTTRL